MTFNEPFEVCQSATLADEVVNQQIVSARLHRAVKQCLPRHSGKAICSGVTHHIYLHDGGIDRKPGPLGQFVRQRFWYRIDSRSLQGVG